MCALLRIIPVESRSVNSAALCCSSGQVSFLVKVLTGPSFELRDISADYPDETARLGWTADLRFLLADCLSMSRFSISHADTQLAESIYTATWRWHGAVATLTRRRRVAFAPYYVLQIMGSGLLFSGRRLKQQTRNSFPCPASNVFGDDSKLPLAQVGLCISRNPLAPAGSS
ncbi:hypothetical protein TARUN_5385 [Trichoderma arundinaceum]|uniref:Uncharacterized protein n=1 Tax=Trichoderma arundinaceum TaxID=490622 RepID=A0A395NLQ5_TRIAR|nr:hypothetical protein TARUN_5385 [Trichoderma arundinaceum]